MLSAADRVNNENKTPVVSTPGHEGIAGVVLLEDMRSKLGLDLMCQVIPQDGLHGPLNQCNKPRAIT